MSSRTPEECVRLAGDGSADPDDRDDAIHELKLANECDELAKLVVDGEIEGRFRRLALRSLGTRQCDATLERLVEEAAVTGEYLEEAEELLEEVAGD